MVQTANGTESRRASEIVELVEPELIVLKTEPMPEGDPALDAHRG